MNITMPACGIKGRFRMVVSKDAEMQDVTQDLEFDNLITDVGMNRIGTVNGSNMGAYVFNALCGRFVVGSGNATPAFTDTALQNPVAFAATVAYRESESSSYERGYYELVMSYQFPQGAAAGNLSEIGIQHTNASGPLWSRALILDAGGAPTSITVLPDDFLTCYYTLRIMIPQTDAVFNIDVDYGADGLVPTVVTARPLATESVAVIGGWGLQTGYTSIGAGTTFRTGGLAAPTANNPGGSSAGSSPDRATRYVPYVHNSFVRHVEQDATLAQYNSDNLQTAKVSCLMGCWQVNFNPPLVKNNTHTMTLTFGYSWARA